MTGSKARFDAIGNLNLRVPRRFELPKDKEGNPLKISEYFGINTFCIEKMEKALSESNYFKLISAIENGKSLSYDVADAVADVVKSWALSKGATHFCHWFQPQTGSTAEKHDAFINIDYRKKALEKFSASQLIQSEPDASSFPSGGMRTTFEARGYTAWDFSSSIFIMEHTNGKTLCIPSVFVSYHGDALDEKSGLLRSTEVLSKKAIELLQLLGDQQVKRVIPTLGIEQEYFLIDRSFFNLRPDLVMTGRTLMGGQSPKGQQLEDHYFGSIPSRVQAFMSEMEYELYKLGVPVKTRHNEVAPSQFETAPIFEEANLAVDHNQLTMEILRKVALRHGLSVLLHEKPFAGINGSGKHNNWSIMSTMNTRSSCFSDGENLLDPGKTPHENLRFLTILLGVLKGVYKHSGLLRASIASAGNDCRLGAHEAPPAIISVFLGDLLSRILNELERGTGTGLSTQVNVLHLGLSQLPQVMKDNTDRNRTSPFAFTGNKFEFRAVGSSASTAFPITVLNSAVADGFSDLIEDLKKRQKDGLVKESDILDVIRGAIAETRSIRFEGNNYSSDWVKEAEKRGLPHLRSTPEALDQLVSPTSCEMLTRLGVFTESELNSRFQVRLERYLKNKIIEMDTLRSMVDTQILPAAYAYWGSLVQGVSAAKSAGFPAPQIERVEKLSDLITLLQTQRKALEDVWNQGESRENERDYAYLLGSLGTRLMEEIRLCCDELECRVSDDYWPLPKYREILFLS